MGKVSGRRTEITYKAVQGWTSLPHKAKSNAARILYGRCGGYIGGKLSFLPGEDLQTGSRKSESRSNNELQEVSRSHSSVFFFSDVYESGEKKT